MKQSSVNVVGVNEFFAMLIHNKCDSVINYRNNYRVALK